MGVRREGQAGWSDDDLALTRAVVDQLAQTMEGLRLMDETQRSAARERLTGQVTARIRETLDIEAVLRTAAGEVRQALDLGDLVIRLAETETDGGSVAGGKK